MGTYCAPLFVDLFLFCYERDFMMSLSDDNQASLLTLLTVCKGCQQTAVFSKELM